MFFMSDTSSSNAYIELTTEIVSAYVSNNSLPTAELPALIEAIYGSLNKIASGTQEVPVETLVPAIAVKKSITPDFIICLEDGKKFKSLKRHLRTKYDMTPDQYRAKWGLPSDYPMVAPNDASARSELAKAMGLGAQRRKPVEPPAPAPRARTPRTVA
jgi:predicted transcriptional regulator